MNKKILGIGVCLLMVVSSVLPVIGIADTINHENVEINTAENNEISSASYLEGQKNAVWINVTPGVNYIGGKLHKRGGHSMAFDSNAGCVILFGGEDNIRYLYETWAYCYANNTWFNRSVIPDPNNIPIHTDMVYDSNADKTILFGGGKANSRINYTYAYDFTTNTWENRSALSSYGEVNGELFPRQDHAMAYDSIADRTILYGGNDPLPDYCSDTWVYNYSDNKWYNMTPTVTVIGGPMPGKGTDSHTMVFDVANNCTVMFGGRSFEGVTGLTNYTYMYYFGNNTWVNKTSSMAVVGGELYPRFHYLETFRSRPWN